MSSATNRVQKAVNSLIEIRSVQDAIKIVTEREGPIKELWQGKESIFPFGIWFRGQSNADWKLIPSVLRTNSKGNPKYEEKSMFIQFKLRMAKKYRQIYHTSCEWLFLMQHYGLPTRMLDWTESILVALYFAVASSDEDEVDGKVFMMNAARLNWYSCLPRAVKVINPARFDALIRADMAISKTCQELNNCMRKSEYSSFKLSFDKETKEYFIDSSESMNFNRLGLPVGVFPYRLHDRMIFQESTCTIHGGQQQIKAENGELPAPFSIEQVADLALQEHVEGHGSTRLLSAFHISRKNKHKIRTQLRRIGIHEGTLFPELEHQAKSIKETWEVE